MNINSSDETSMNDLFNKLFKNPTKLMSLVKNVGTKLDDKIKKGDEETVIAGSIRICFY